GNIYLNGPAFDAPQNLKAYQLHKYNAKFDYEKSFHSFNPKIVELNLWSERGITLDIDDLDNLYVAEPIEYKISKYNESGELLASFTRNAKFYIPPSRLPDMPEKKEEKAAAALRAWFPTWTHLIRLVCYKGIVLVQFRVHQPKQYLIEIFDYDGNYVMGEILTDCQGPPYSPGQGHEYSPLGATSIPQGGSRVFPTLFQATPVVDDACEFN
ncbi:MAG: hypothetical protein ACRENG_15305, partial [bacterium]